MVKVNCFQWFQMNWNLFLEMLLPQNFILFLITDCRRSLQKINVDNVVNSRYIYVVVTILIRGDQRLNVWKHKKWAVFLCLRFNTSHFKAIWESGSSNRNCSKSQINAFRAKLQSVSTHSKTYVNSMLVLQMRRKKTAWNSSKH